MGIFDRIKKNFVSDEDKINQSHLRNFFLIAISGKKISDKDYQFIENLGIELNLSKTLIYEVFNVTTEIKTYVPKHHFQRNKNIYDYILFANRNGEIIEEEKHTCKFILIALTSLTEKSASKILDQIIELVLKTDTVNGLTYDTIGRLISQEYLSYLTSDK